MDGPLSLGQAPRWLVEDCPHAASERELFPVRDGPGCLEGKMHNCLAKAQTPIGNHWHRLCFPLAKRLPGHLHLSFKYGLGQV